MWGSLQVSKAARNQGIATAMMQWASIHFGLEKETVWAVTLVAGVQVFTKHGFEKVDVNKIDLSKCAGKDSGSRGFQLSCMLRRRGELL